MCFIVKMVRPQMSHEDRILIKQLRIKDHRSGKPWGVKRLQKEFPWKNWKSSTLKDLLRKLDNTGSLAFPPTEGCRRGRWAYRTVFQLICFVCAILLNWLSYAKSLF